MPDMDLAAARAALEVLRPRIANYLGARADLSELRADLAAHGVSPVGWLAEAQGLEARLYADIEHFTAHGADVKGLGPLLLDFPGTYLGRLVQWCWLEGEDGIAWYHRADTGFAGRRAIT